MEAWTREAVMEVDRRDSGARREVEWTGHGEGFNVGHEGGEVSGMLLGFLTRMGDGAG